ncbi:MAG: T9SS type A sorting domain-containing protein [Balneolaceae bacterium]
MKVIKIHVCLGILLALNSYNAYAQAVSPINFSSSTISSAENGATDVFAIDLDEDGDVDILSSSYLDDTIAWYENDGSGSFTQHNINTSANGASSVFAIDVDGDDDIDVVSVAYSDDAVYWFENNGSESFTRHTLTTSIDGPRHAFPADIDEDDDIDIIVASSNDGKITFYENNGSEVFTETTILSSMSGATNVFVKDLDNDRDLDVIYAADVADEFGWLENDGSESFTKHTIGSSLDGVKAVFVEDINDDSYMDIAVAVYNTDEIAWYENDGSESFTKHSLSTSEDGANDVFASDLDYDGDIDLVSASNNDDSITWYENDGTESFTSHSVATTIDGARTVFAADISNGYGLDILSASFFDDSIVLFKNSTTQSRFTGLVPTVSSFSPFNRPYETIAKDFDRDGDIDLVAVHPSADKIFWLNNDGDGNFNGSAETLISETIDFPKSPYVLDLDLDGDFDIIVASLIDEELYWFENSGDQSFTQHKLSTDSINVHSPVGADIDQDGDVDIVVSDYNTNTTILFENDGSQNFSQSTLFNDGLRKIELTDLDEDGDLDIVAIDIEHIEWYENTGAGSYINYIIYTHIFGLDVAVADLDGDGDKDLISIFSDDAAFWHENDGTESFTTHVISKSIDNPRSVDIVDFDLDGDIDLLIHGKGDDDLWLFENTGEGSFLPHNIIYGLEFSGGSSSDIFFADLNGDMLPDIVPGILAGASTFYWFRNPLHKPNFPNFSKTSISSTSTSAIATIDIDSDGDQDIVSTGVSLILNKNNGSGSFTQSTLASGLSTTRDLVPIDMDGDGDIDIVTAEFSGDEISWYENDGAGSFSDNNITTTVDGPIAVEVADLDKDGDLDVIAAIDNDGEFVWYENNGSESFTEHVISTSYSDPSDLKVIDMDNDGDLDIVGSSKLDLDVFWFENNGSESFTAHTIDPSLTLVSTLDVGDIDQDGDVDVIAVGSSDINIYLNNGSQSFSESTVSSVTTLGKVMLKDVDLDGDIDVVFLNAGAQKIGWLENDGSENFTEHIVGSELSQLVRGLGVADLNGDGKLDFISGSEGLSANISWHENSTYVDQVTLGGTVGAQWRLFSLPKSGAKLSDVSNFLNLQGITDGSNSSSDANIFTYDNSGAWEEPSSVNDALVDGYGFAVYIFDSISDSLNIRGSEPAADVSVSLNKSTLESGSYYTLVGNPYYSNYNLNSLTVNSGNLQDNVSFWDAKGQTYQVKDRISNYIISPYQGFWVGVTNGNSATTLTFPRSGKTDSDTSGTWLRKQNGFKGDLEFSLQTENGFRDDAIRLAVRDYATQDWDRADAGKLKSLSSSYVSLAFEGNIDNEIILKSVESLPETLDNIVTLPMDLISIDVEGSATLSWKFIKSLPNDWDLLFQDLKTGQSINMREYSEYNFELSGFLEKDTGTALKVNHSSSPRFNIVISKGLSVSNEREELPSEFSLSQNYPNPFNPSTTIKYTLSEAGKVNITVFNLLGQRIRTLVDEQKPVGNYEIRFDASSLTSGVYFYKMQSNNFTAIQKMTLIK